ncbi:hypothetical protein AB1Y20_020881 [Prymnesium parvum]|uniref:protein xylosyltransferase n=1 Tax=Prymnesium parvum TaxID=97485 RepID=A0AB34JZG3_PRYPA
MGVPSPAAPRGGRRLGSTDLSPPFLSPAPSTARPRRSPPCRVPSRLLSLALFASFLPHLSRAETLATEPSRPEALATDPSHAETLATEPSRAEALATEPSHAETLAAEPSRAEAWATEPSRGYELGRASLPPARLSLAEESMAGVSSPAARLSLGANSSLSLAAVSPPGGEVAQLGQRPALGATRASAAVEPERLVREEEALQALEPTASASVREAEEPPRDYLSDFAGRPLSNASASLSRRCRRAVEDVLQREATHAPPPIYSDPLSGVVVAPLKASTDVRIVYVIGLGPRPYAHRVISRMLYALYAPSHLFLLHADIKASKEALAECVRIAEKYPNVHILRTRRLVQWGMFSMVAITLDAMRSVLDSGLPFDYLINLSDADLALRTDAEMQGFLQRVRGRSLINVHEGGGEQLVEANKFIDAHTIVECGGYGFVVVNKTHDAFPLTAGCCIGRSGPAAFGTLPLDTHRLLRERQPHTGSQWVALHRDFCRYVLDPAGGAIWLNAFERRLVPDESFFQTVVMHSPFKNSLLNHNLRWIDWPHQYGDANEYWERLGGRKYVGGPKVLNVSELPRVLMSPYMFARKVDLEIDPGVLPVWDAWMKKKLSGSRVAQSPIGHSPGDPNLLNRFRAPGIAAGTPAATTRTYWGRRRIARVDFIDGSRCACGLACRGTSGGCCADSVCAPGAIGFEAPAAPCPQLENGVTHLSHPGGLPLQIQWVNRARHPVSLFVLDFAGAEVSMRVLRRTGEVATFMSRVGVTWRARALNGALMLQHTPSNSRNSTVEVPECAFEPSHALWAHLRESSNR